MNLKVNLAKVRSTSSSHNFLGYLFEGSQMNHHQENFFVKKRTITSHNNAVIVKIYCAHFSDHAVQLDA